MGMFISNIFSSPKDHNILVLGLKGAGKTTIIYQLKLGEIQSHMHSIDFNYKTLTYKNIKLSVFDISRQSLISKIIPKWYKNT